MAKKKKELSDLSEEEVRELITPQEPEHQCELCDHYVENGRCMAFPLGIPEDIWSGKKGHDTVVEGQMGDLTAEYYPIY